jgi:histidine phosphotransferase ChpT
MGTNTAHLAEMLCTRLCHDLTGPIGAVNNGAEFLAEDGFDMGNDALQLILSSADEAVARLMFYRQAYGRTSESGEASLSEKKQLAGAFFKNSKVTLDWPDHYGDACAVSVSHRGARLILNFLIIAANSLIRGGVLHVRIDAPEEGAKRVVVEAEGQTIKLDPSFQAILEGDRSVPLCPKTSQLYLTADLALELDAKLQLAVSDTRMTISAQTQVMAEAAA